MFNLDIGRMIVGIVLLGAVVGSAIVMFALLALPWLWALAKPTLHAWTV